LESIRLVYALKLQGATVTRVANILERLQKFVPFRPRFIGEQRPETFQGERLPRDKQSRMHDIPNTHLAHAAAFK
jgi:hypothetical protein